MFEEKLDFSIQNASVERLVEIGLAYVSIPLRYFIFQYQMIAKRVPSELADLPVILVRVASAMRKNNIWINFSLHRFEAVFQCGALVLEVAVLDVAEDDFSSLCS
jgi:hypothetical protein